MRPTLDEYMMKITQIVATRSTCLRRAVGCVLVNVHGRILATGYNGVAAGLPHCNMHDGAVYPAMCQGAELPPGQDRCEAIHAEANALIWCRETDKIDTAYVTLPPCVPCTKLLLGTSAQRIVCCSDHPQAAQAKNLWEKAGREWQQL